MISLTYKFVFALLLSKINAFFKNSDENSPEHQTKFNLGHEDSGQSGFLGKLYNLKNAPEISRDEGHKVLSKWSLEPTKKNSFTHREHIQEKDNYFNFKAPLQYIEEEEFNLKNTIYNKVLSSSYYQPGEKCPPIKNDIALLFNNEGTLETDSTKIISRTFSSESTCETDSTKFVETESIKEKCTQKVTCSSSHQTTCSAIKEISTPLFYMFTCGTSSGETKLNTTCTKHKKHEKTTKSTKCTTPTVINNSFQQVSHESNINLIVHVHCDKSEGKTHVIPQIPIFTSPIRVQNIYITPNMMTQPPYSTYQSYSKAVDSQLSSPYLNLNQYGPMQQTQNVLFQTNNLNLWSQKNSLNSLNQPTTTDFEKPMSKIKLGEVPCEREEESANVEQNSKLCQEATANLETQTSQNYALKKNTQKKLPRPLLPRDVASTYKTPASVEKYTHPTTINNTFKLPMFLCQISNSSCNVTQSKKSTSIKKTTPLTIRTTSTPQCMQMKPRKLTTPKFQLWKYFSFPNFEFKELCSKNISLPPVTCINTEKIVIGNCESKTTSPIEELQTTSSLEDDTDCIEETLCETQDTNCIKETSCETQDTNCIKETSCGTQDTTNCIKETSCGTQGTTNCIKETSCGTQGTTNCIKETSCETQGTTNCTKETSCETQGTTNCIKETSCETHGTTNCIKETSCETHGTTNCIKETSCGTLETKKVEEEVEKVKEDKEVKD